MDCIAGVLRKPWSLPFTAEPQEVAALRRIMRLHLGLWGLHGVIDAAQLCVSELVSNVIKHVGAGTPTTLVVSMRGSRVRIEVYDPDPRALPTLLDGGLDAESGRGMALVSAVTDRWGVQLQAEQKVTWCELPSGLPSAEGHSGGTRVNRVEALLSSYGSGQDRWREAGAGAVSVVEDVAIDVVVDILHWLWAHGCDVDEALERAQTRFEADVE
ncbi:MULTISPECIES: ATP-binding protein [unclassified Streptomyces]|uniref:ATP-binding protein n=1 Tax=unclassified Streptomyces TaxID=2593676 RepID=UPI001BB07869|nr:MULTISPECIES: ATP-binding protein [unclassified Streptomyces]MDH6450470.1 anti-sigma regulatory factor (Ser/Thr protein kinase) [Streptomyces sp. SAI-119]MDH6498986.1 anti-sigma regulatory factor (Ser/Thr protein kinase) [Streptomyces sp. SAI-149]QUC62249.1 ATP-binding protein [Streptomyces sp. A2-16]